MESPDLYIEALIFASENSIRLEEIAYCLQLTFERDFTPDEISKSLESISTKYNHQQIAIELININNGYQFLTKKTYHPVVKQLQLQRSKKKLGQAALETLAVIAYKQPLTKLDIEHIRGVNCDYAVQKLLEKDLVTIIGKADTVGKPLLYATSAFFMDYFGINNLRELPQLKELMSESTVIGETSE